MSSRTESAIRIQVLRLRAELNSLDVKLILKLIEEYMHGGLIYVILNMESVTHINLADIPSLARRAHALRECGGDLKLVGLSPYLVHLWDLAGYSFQFDICASEEEAERRFSHMRVAA